MADGGMARANGGYTILAFLSATYLVDSFFRAAPSALSNVLITKFGLNWSFWSWMPKFLIDTKRFSYVEAGLLTSVPTVTGVAGCIIVGALSDRLKRRKLPLAIFAAMNVL